MFSVSLSNSRKGMGNEKRGSGKGEGKNTAEERGGRRKDMETAECL